MSTFRDAIAVDPHASGALTVAILIARRFPRDPPTVPQLRDGFRMSRATAYRYRRAWLDAAGSPDFKPPRTRGDKGEIA